MARGSNLTASSQLPVSESSHAPRSWVRTTICEFGVTQPSLPHLHTVQDDGVSFLSPGGPLEVESWEAGRGEARAGVHSLSAAGRGFLSRPRRWVQEHRSHGSHLGVSWESPLGPVSAARDP